MVRPLVNTREPGIADRTLYSVKSKPKKKKKQNLLQLDLVQP